MGGNKLRYVHSSLLVELQSEKKNSKVEPSY